MRIHTNTITRQDLYANLPDGCDLEVTTHGSRKRDHAFEVGMSAEHGTDAHGIKRAFARNPGTSGRWPDSYDRAATWVEWGDWMVELFKLDPEAIIGPYDGQGDFVRQTHEAAPYRPKRENAEQHADRWSTELFYARERTHA